MKIWKITTKRLYATVHEIIEETSEEAEMVIYSKSVEDLEMADAEQGNCIQMNVEVDSKPLDKEPT